ncbi:MAG: hypothetical protein N3D17_07830 [bacterium]|nr:hypothetical protein [bacterium]
MKTIGEFYKEKILSLPKKLLTRIILPENSSEIKIEKRLFKWELRCEKEVLECESEEEARYLKIFVESGLREVYIPKDKNYLKQILPELENLKKDIDEIIIFYTSGLLNKKIKEKVISEVYKEIIKYDEE